MARMTETIINIGYKLSEMFQTVYGWIAAAGIFIVNFFAGYEGSIHAVIACVLLDTIWGIAAQIKRGHFALSEVGRHGLFSKFALYASAIVGFILIERMAGIDSQITVIAICSIICLIELWSMAGSALIVNPKMRFLRIFRQVLAGEVARKMQISVEDARSYLDGCSGDVEKS
jgi:hypothetical protein